jgi:hypothetical protein
MGRILRESVLRLNDVPGEMGLPVCSVTVGRWARVGVRGTRLEVVKVGGKVLTSKEAVQRFLSATNVGCGSGSLAAAVA